jgi:hypothetical protein
MTLTHWNMLEYLQSMKCCWYIHIYIYICKRCIQQEEESFYQHIGLKFEEESSKMLHLEHGFVLDLEEEKELGMQLGWWE